MSNNNNSDDEFANYLKEIGVNVIINIVNYYRKHGISKIKENTDNRKV